MTDKSFKASTNPLNPVMMKDSRKILLIIAVVNKGRSAHTLQTAVKVNGRNLFGWGGQLILWGWKYLTCAVFGYYTDFICMLGNKFLTMFW